MIKLVRFKMAMPFAFALLLMAPNARAADAGDIVVVSTKGEVHVTMSGVARVLRVGSVLEPPASLRTGRDGAIELKQGATTLSVGPESLLEFPALEKRGAPIDHVIQPRGNVFYNIGKRGGRKLRVEAPYLVGVVKGTQFNVAAQDESTTISLFEGALDVRSANGGDTVDLAAGQIASGRRGETSITVLKMSGEGAPPTSRTQTHSSGDSPIADSLRLQPSKDGSDQWVVDIDLGGDIAPRSFTDSTGAEVTRGGGELPLADVPGQDNLPGAASVPFTTGPDVEVVAGASSDPVVDISASAVVNAAPEVVVTALDEPVSAPVDPIPVIVDPEVAADVAADVGANVGVSAGAGAGAGAGVDLVSTGVSAGVGLDVAPSADNQTPDAGPGRPSVIVTVDVGGNAGGVAADRGLGASSRVMPEQAGASVDLNFGVAADLSSGNAAANANVEVVIDSGLSQVLDDATGEPAADVDGTVATPTPPATDVDNLLENLRRRPGRR